MTSLNDTWQTAILDMNAPSLLSPWPSSLDTCGRQMLEADGAVTAVATATCCWPVQTTEAVGLTGPTHSEETLLGTPSVKTERRFQHPSIFNLLPCLHPTTKLIYRWDTYVFQHLLQMIVHLGCWDDVNTLKVRRSLCHWESKPRLLDASSNSKA